MSDTASRLTAALADRYRIERELGQGGMATVYLAQDLRHHRPVAVKVLHPDLAAALGAERFLAEIRTTANLQHPHILPLHDSGEADGFLFYVMPYIEGETLRARLEREKQLPIGDAVRLATEIAGALDYAHRHRVVHRDIKPENILLHDGSALVADFGIALAVTAAAGARMTQTGMSLGTPQYMSPEQAMGERSLDARADIYALGCVTYEMLVGNPPFTGATVQAIVAKVMNEKPTPPTAVRDTVPPHVEDAVLVALAKLPADRWGSAAEFAEALKGGQAQGRKGARQLPSARPAARLSVVVLLGALLIVSALALYAWLRPVGSPRQPTTRFSVAFEGADFLNVYDAPAISPDGRTFAYSDGSNGLLLRKSNELTASVIPGVETAWSPFFSPDGTGLGFVTGLPGDLKLMTLATGAVETVARDSVFGDGATWSDDGWVYFTAGRPRALLRVRSSGSPPDLVLRADTTKEELFLRWPHALPGGKAVLVTRWYRKRPPDVVLVEVPGGHARVLTQGVRGFYEPGGHLIVVRGSGSIAVAPFNLKRGEVSGDLREQEQAVFVGYMGTAHLGLSAGGTLAYYRATGRNLVVRVDRSGVARAIDSSWTADIVSLALSPDGTRLAVGAVVEGRGEIWVKTLPTGPFTRVSDAGSLNYRPFWSDDGRWIGYVSDASGSLAPYRVAADGSGDVEPLTRIGRVVDEGLWSRDSKWLIVRAGSGGGRDILGIRPGVDSVPVPLVATPAEEYSPALSPDGRWLAYASYVSGRDEVYVRPFPETGKGRWQISVAGGTEPVWSHSGRELFYRDGASNLIAVSVASGVSFQVLGHRTLFSTRDYITDTRHSAYAVSADDQSFIFAKQRSGLSNQLTVVQNWFEELKGRNP